MSEHWQYLMPLNAAIDDRVALVVSGTLGTCRCLAIRPSLAALPTELQQNEIIHAVLGHRTRRQWYYVSGGHLPNVARPPSRGLTIPGFITINHISLVFFKLLCSVLHRLTVEVEGVWHQKTLTQWCFLF